MAYLSSTQGKFKCVKNRKLEIKIYKKIKTRNYPKEKTGMSKIGTLNSKKLNKHQVVQPRAVADLFRHILPCFIKKTEGLEDSSIFDTVKLCNCS